MSQEDSMTPVRLNIYSVNRLLTLVLLVLTIGTAIYILKLCYTYEVSSLRIALTGGSNQCSDQDDSTKINSPTILLSDAKYKSIRHYHSRTLQFSKEFHCGKLFEADELEQEKAMLFTKLHQNQFQTLPESMVPSMLSDCQAFKEIRGYRLDSGQQEEEEFPLAYIILVHRDFEHLERLLRALYRPQHTFCIHVDAKASEHLKKAVSLLVGCFKNMALASEAHTIIYAHISRLAADITCMKDLLELDSKWKYVINYAATEFPLRTNLETVKILKSLNGKNDIHESYKARIKDRFQSEYSVINGKMTASQVTMAPPPYNLTITKGQAYNSFTREFVEWVLTEQIPRDFLTWSEKTYSPDEHYWGTLNNLYHNQFLNTPGGFQGEPDKKGYITKFISWQYRNARHKCQGQIIHSICVFSSLDLPTIMVQMHLAANKFDLTYDPIAYACIEELHTNKTLAHVPFDRAFYKNLHFVKYTVGHK
ncbi:beta-1,3-galactosyl-O-glycosyl-glycoprotein beta-1,6-N-acetylglucosaminyltransferase-like [Biomphalaria glabrata]|uniref:Beta-1,3-galactosyl-O-glycosyl-glycoprotein beta-1,6-N-acetylglucosaminyltransferase-like n=1 Tax=Biomphalaria glabrata TaxID=6526 RepID=A0A9W2YF22_BIOGL|nr:beta-1,3-galactosyl-O-glycosyl-glycoprotein beta-1,6-N-acetylglucosaminyltransferase-like [Biomphalaria glabrata]XP_055861325.1 beta-1,3-galactosyl-O-glycosyl-glycoprotein beta-1,6-N-acetylglucosaminyltransferase-like [Biomphalaria glabrata]XP_055861326.1 beta-1,3-galactosyl-O-glycosyl-glycoprotein beta-1,6-N-acetylglucosaminyltransferase-like [Biomphalaria glabrata]XP_055861327.1 beta-1,3-galactosyl-O-glycosyl-glycoprotein beta-1,6-N-acetylglucosaminyltransferase-like [Biomphalaria glabrata]